MRKLYQYNKNILIQYNYLYLTLKGQQQMCDALEIIQSIVSKQTKYKHIMFVNEHWAGTLND